jgi:hypothetical protein
MQTTHDPQAFGAGVSSPRREMPRVGIQQVGTAGTAGTAGGPFLTSETTRKQGGQLGQRFAPSEDPERKSGGVFRVVWVVSKTRWYGLRFFYFLKTLESAFHADHPVPDSFI